MQKTLKEKKEKKETTETNWCDSKEIEQTIASLWKEAIREAKQEFPKEMEKSFDAIQMSPELVDVLIDQTERFILCLLTEATFQTPNQTVTLDMIMEAFQRNNPAKTVALNNEFDVNLTLNHYCLYKMAKAIIDNCPKMPPVLAAKLHALRKTSDAGRDHVHTPSQTRSKKEK